MGGGQTLRVAHHAPGPVRLRRRSGAPASSAATPSEWEKRNEDVPRRGRQGQRGGQAARDRRRRPGLRPARLEGPGRGAEEARDQARPAHHRRRPHLDQLAALPQRARAEAVPVNRPVSSPGTRWPVALGIELELMISLKAFTRRGKPRERERLLSRTGRGLSPFPAERGTGTGALLSSQSPFSPRLPLRVHPLSVPSRHFAILTGMGEVHSRSRCEMP